MYSEYGLTRYAARFANSSGLPNRFIGWAALSRAAYSGDGISRDHAPSVGNGPGAIAFTRTPNRAHSIASDRVIASTPAFAHADGTTNPDPLSAYVVTILRTVPRCPCAIQRRAVAS